MRGLIKIVNYYNSRKKAMENRTTNEMTLYELEKDSYINVPIFLKREDNLWVYFYIGIIIGLILGIIIASICTQVLK